MLKPKFNWYARILRNSEPEVHVTVVETPPVEIPPAPAPAAAAEVLQAAQEIVTLTQRQDNSADLAPIYSRLDELSRKQDEILSRLSEVQTTATVAAVAALETESMEEQEQQAPTELPTIPIPADTVKVEVEAPKTRKRRWI